MQVVATAVNVSGIDTGISEFSFPHFKTLKHQEHSYIKSMSQITMQDGILTSLSIAVNYQRWPS